jgi:hypothetical protein
MPTARPVGSLLQPMRMQVRALLADRAGSESVMDDCCICGLPSPDGFDHEICYEEGTIDASEVEE